MQISDIPEEDWFGKPMNMILSSPQKPPNVVSALAFAPSLTHRKIN